MRDTESASGVQVLASSGPPKSPASPDVGRLIQRSQDFSDGLERFDPDGMRYHTMKLVRDLGDALTALQARETATEARNLALASEIGRERTAKEQAEARETALRQERDDAQKQCASAERELNAAFTEAETLRQAQARLMGFVAKWRATAVATDTHHATMGVGWHACAADLENALASVDPLPVSKEAQRQG